MMDPMSFAIGFLLGLLAALAIAFERLLTRHEKNHLHVSADDQGLLVIKTKVVRKDCK